MDTGSMTFNYPTGVCGRKAYMDSLQVLGAGGSDKLSHAVAI